MKIDKLTSRLKILFHATIVVTFFSVFLGYPSYIGYAGAADKSLAPLLEKGHPVDWWFVFKFNAASYPGCAAGGKDARE